MSSRKILATLCLLFLSLFCETEPISAAYFSFSPATQTVAKQELLQIDLLANTDGEQVSAADAYIEYDNSMLSIQSVVNRAYFPYQTHSITGNRIALRGLTFDSGSFVMGTGIMASITFQVLAEGSTTITVFCDKNVSTTSRMVKNDITASNIINCTRNGSVALTIAGPSATPTPTPTPTLSLTASPCSLKNTGDADCSGLVTLTDFEIWRKEFTGELTTTKADFNATGTVTIADFEVWRKNFFP